MFTEAQLKGMKLLELRKAASQVGLKPAQLSGKRTAEIIRLIKTASKPGGVDPRINPAKAAAAKAAAGNKNTQKAVGGWARQQNAQQKPAPVAPTTNEAFDEPDTNGNGHDLEAAVDENPQLATLVETLRGQIAIVSSLDATVKDLTTRLALIEKASIDANILDPQSLGVARASLGERPQTDETELPDVDQFFDDQGNISITPEEVKDLTSDSIIALNERMSQAGIPCVQGASYPKWRRDPRAARDALMKVLLKIPGAVRQEGDATEEEPAAAVDDGGVWPPEQPGVVVQAYAEDVQGWYPSTILKIYADADGNPLYSVDMEYEGELFTLDDMTLEDIAQMPEEA